MKGLVSLAELSCDHEPKTLMRRLRADVATRQSVRIAVAVMSGEAAVQIFGINTMKRSGTLRG